MYLRNVLPDISICANKLVPEPVVFPDLPPAPGVLLADDTEDGFEGVAPKLNPAVPVPKVNLPGAVPVAGDLPKFDVPCPKVVALLCESRIGKTT